MAGRNGRSACDWCEAPASCEDTQGDAGVACADHRHELERLVEARAFKSGNRWTGDASSAAVREIRTITPRSTEEVTRALPSGVHGFTPERAANSAIIRAYARARSWDWPASGAALAEAYRALGAEPPHGSDDMAASTAFHRGAHPIQVAAQDESVRS